MRQRYRPNSDLASSAATDVRHTTRRAGGAEHLRAALVSAGPDARYGARLRGLVPVQRLNARENALGSEKPTRYAVSFTDAFRAFR